MLQFDGQFVLNTGYSRKKTPVKSSKLSVKSY